MYFMDITLLVLLFFGKIHCKNKDKLIESEERTGDANNYYLNNTDRADYGYDTDVTIEKTHVYQLSPEVASSYFQKLPQAPTERTTTTSATPAESTTTSTTTMLPIMMPMAMSSITPMMMSNNNENNNENKSEMMRPIMNITKAFVPSPQLPSHYEYNPFPVAPAYPESKHLFSSLSHSSKPLKLDTYIPSTNKYYHKPESNLYDKAVSWFGNVKFPSTGHQSSVVSIKDQPYPYHIDGTPSPTIKSFSVLPAEEHSFVEKPHHHKKSISPWKKIIHFITTFLPIGLFLSALTPTILNITPVNSSMEAVPAARSLDNGYAGDTDLHSWLKTLESVPDDIDCQARLLCTMAVRGSASDAPVVDRTLWYITTQTSEMMKEWKQYKHVYKAIKRKSCEDIPCNRFSSTNATTPTTTQSDNSE